MRLHHLEVTAFGPFADTVSVDFDALSDAGLFLLTGATGAGKTSVLDAVCFALYGDVPGDRGAAKRLRSDQADPAVAPLVTLEATLSGRRFRIARSPAWERAKRRGAGLTTQQASVTIAERIDAEWRTLSTRLDETGHLVTALVGMNLDQFCQVAMLPQGRFQAFLRARSEDRHRLLQQLFRTGRFEAMERWLRDHRLALRRTSQLHQESVAGLVNRTSEAAGVAAGDWEPGGLDEAATGGLVDRWADDLRAVASTDAARARTELAGAEAAAEVSASGLADGRRVAERQARWSAALAERVRLDADEKFQRGSAERLDAAARASRVLPLAALADRAVRAADELAVVATAAVADAAALGVAPDGLASARGEAQRSAAAAQALVPREMALVGLRASLGTYAAHLARLDDETSRHDRDLDRLPDRLAACRRELSAVIAASAALPPAEAALTRLRDRHGAAAQVVSLASRLDEARRDLEAAADDVRRLKESWLEVREQRLDGMAAEIAIGLVVGGSCPVCGSADHPRLARAAQGAPDADLERAARRRVDDAEATVLLRDGLVRDLTTRIALAEQLAGQSAGDEAPSLSDLLAGAEQEVTTLRVSAAAAPQREAELRRLEAHAADLRQRREAARLERAGVAAAAAAKRADVAAITAELQTALWGADDPDVTSRSRRLTALAAVCDAALTAGAEAGAATAEADRTRTALLAALTEAGFGEVTEARAAALTAPEAERLTVALRRHEDARAATRRVLDDRDLASDAGRPVPDLELLAAADVRARAAVAAATATARATGTRDTRIYRLHRELTGALTAWGPVRDELTLATGLAAMVDGRSPDNGLQMRLSAYVLSYRLAQVVESANDRLARMSDRRYSLAHTGRRGAGENRGGLSLLVRDDWSGETRDPATLSGGETFVVSLALALGLADVITDESDSAAAGDSRLATLFVDEGFGSLDADTLDDVMDTLDSLREGGRVVGVVSHVAEMRDRIPTQLEVTKSRRGSRLRTSTGVLGSGA